MDIYLYENNRKEILEVPNTRNLKIPCNNWLYLTYGLLYCVEVHGEEVVAV